MSIQVVDNTTYSSILTPSSFICGEIFCAIRGRAASVRQIPLIETLDICREGLPICRDNLV